MSCKSCNATYMFNRKFKTRCIGEVLARYKDQLELKTTQKLRAETFLLFANVVKMFEVVQVPCRPPCLDGTMAMLVTIGNYSFKRSWWPDLGAATVQRSSLPKKGFLKLHIASCINLCQKVVMSGYCLKPVTQEAVSKRGWYLRMPFTYFHAFISTIRLKGIINFPNLIFCCLFSLFTYSHLFTLCNPNKSNQTAFYSM